MTPNIIIKNFKQPKEYFVIFSDFCKLSFCIKINNVYFLSDWNEIAEYNEHCDIMNSNFHEINQMIFNSINENYFSYKISLEHLKEPKAILKDFVEYFI